MIKGNKALSMAEAQEYISENNPEINAFVKNFTKLTFEQGKEMREKLLSLDLIKLNEKHISKIIDVIPEDKDELNKVLSDVNFDENEINNILSTIKEFK